MIIHNFLADQHEFTELNKQHSSKYNRCQTKTQHNKTKKQWHASPPSYNLLRRISVVITSAATASEPCLLYLTPKNRTMQKTKHFAQQIAGHHQRSIRYDTMIPSNLRQSEDQELETTALNKLGKMVDRWKKIAASFSPLRPPFHGFIITKTSGKTESARPYMHQKHREHLIHCIHYKHRIHHST